MRIRVYELAPIGQPDELLGSMALAPDGQSIVYGPGDVGYPYGLEREMRLMGRMHPDWSPPQLVEDMLYHHGSRLRVEVDED